MTSPRSLLLGLLVLGLTAPTARAQSADSAVTPAPASAALPAAPTVPETPARPAGPTLDAASVGVRAAPVDASRPSYTAEQQGFGRAETLMIVGGAAFVAGLLIGDDAGTIVMVGGAVMGLYGLYLYLQTQ